MVVAAADVVEPGFGVVPVAAVEDLVLLGVGADGHTAGLFWGDIALNEKRSWVTAVKSPAATPPCDRITLTLPALNSADTVIFLVSGKDKRDTVRMILDDPERARKLHPAAMVRPKKRLVWFTSDILDE